MTRLETPDHDLVSRLRASLDERASDVSASPELWEKVDDRITARRRSTMFALAGSFAVVAAAAAIVVPNLLDDDGPRQPQILEQPGGEASEGDGGPGTLPIVTGAFDSPEYGVAVQDGELVVIHLASAEAVDSFPLASEDVRALAARPRQDGNALVFAYVVADGVTWDVRVLRIEALAPNAGLGNLPASDESVARIPMTANGRDVLQPGVAWSPNGGELSWVETISQGDGTVASILQVQRWGADGPMEGEVHPGMFLADGDTAGRLTLKDWTWDAQFEDGRVGRLFLTGDGRSWDVEITHSFDYWIEGLNPIDVGDDFDEAGPEAGVFSLLMDQGDGALRIRSIDDGAQSFSYGHTLSEADPSAVDFAIANDTYLISLGTSLVMGDRNTTGSPLDNGGAWGPVDLIVDPWLPVFQDEGGMVPNDKPTEATGDPTLTPADLPQFVVTTDGSQIDLRWSDGRLIQTLVRANVLEGEILGLDVRPGSSTEDLTVVGTVAKDQDGRVRAFSLRGRADDQAGLSVVLDEWSEAYQPSAGAAAFVDGERTVPHFTNDGEYVGFVENDGQTATLRVFGWVVEEASPGTGDSASDNASWELGSTPVSLEWFSAYFSTVDGTQEYLFKTTDALGQSHFCRLERQGDGGLGFLGCEQDAGWDFPVLDVSDDDWRMFVRDGRIELMDIPASLESLGEVDLPLPEEIVFGDPVVVWLTGGDRFAFVGDGQRAWLVTHEGAQEFDGPITWISAVR